MHVPPSESFRLTWVLESTAMVRFTTHAFVLGATCATSKKAGKTPAILEKYI